MYPIVALSLTGLITLFLGFNRSRQGLLPATIFFLLVAAVLNFLDWNAPGTYFSNMVEVSNQGILFSTIVILAAAFIVAISGDFASDSTAQPAEYYALMQFALVGAVMMILFKNLIMLFLGIEILSISVYVLTGSDKQNIRGNEAALKYFLMGAFATGILLFGMAMYYGGVGTFDVVNATSMVQNVSGDLSVYLSIGIVFMLMGLFFKVSAAPFHFWTPDVYEGAPTLFTAFMSTIVKTAGFAAIFKIMYVSFLGAYSFWIILVVGMTILTLVIGNIIAVYQASFKRMLAYSSISHAGYLMLALVGLREASGESIWFYSAAYTLATITAFTILYVVSRQKLVNGRPDEQISVLNGLKTRNPFMAFALAVSMLSLAGIPLTGGFWGKFLVFSDAASKGYWWILVVAIILSAVGMYYYFKPIRAAFLKNAEDESPLVIRPAIQWVLILTTTGTLLLGIFPDVIRQLF